jgi:peptidoglycan-associated lipoprotein
MKYRLISFSVVLPLALLLAACEGTMDSKEQSEGAAVEERATGETATTRGLEGAGTFKGHPLDDPSSLLSKRTVYFDFDRSDIKSDDRPVIEAHAKYLSQNPGAALTLEGHADERGSREYNVALGERRANAVRRLMGLLGASDQQMQTVSFGEEHPVALGHNESAWRQNRRVEINYRTR